MIRRVHSVASRVLVGLGVAVAALAAIGYAFIFSGIATPVARDLGTVAVPNQEGAVPVYLSDGRPAFVLRSEDGVRVIDARPPLRAGEPGRLIAWCGVNFTDVVGAAAYAPGGELLAGNAPSGLIVYPTRATAGGDELVVGAGGSPSGAIASDTVPTCEVNTFVVHEPREGEVFDPSVAADEEPPGWVWLEGRLEAIGGQAMLCDPGRDCASGAVARGIDPAKVATGAAVLDGLFLARIRDGAIEELHYVPHPEAGR